MDEHNDTFASVGYLLNKAKKELDGAGLLLQNSFPEIAISRSWYATYHASRALLEILGEIPKDNEQLIQQFHWRLVESGLVPQEQGKSFQDLYFNHLKVDKYYPSYFSDEEAKSITLQAANLVGLLSSVIEQYLKLLESEKKEETEKQD